MLTTPSRTLSFYQLWFRQFLASATANNNVFSSSPYKSYLRWNWRKYTFSSAEIVHMTQWAVRERRIISGLLLLPLWVLWWSCFCCWSSWSKNLLAIECLSKNNLIGLLLLLFQCTAHVCRLQWWIALCFDWQLFARKTTWISRNQTEKKILRNLTSLCSSHICRGCVVVLLIK